MGGIAAERVEPVALLVERNATLPVPPIDVDVVVAAHLETAVIGCETDVDVACSIGAAQQKIQMQVQTVIVAVKALARLDFAELLDELQLLAVCLLDPFAGPARSDSPGPATPFAV